MEKIKLFIRNETVLLISFMATLISSFFVHPSKNYILYIDFQLLSILFCLMVIVSGLKKVGLFNVLPQRMTEGSKKSKMLRLSLVLICFFSSMFITNDVALITFVPFAITVLTVTAQSNYLIYVIAMQTVAANLGSMLTPIGNPQNLYLYSFYNIGTAEFFKITLPVTIASLILTVLFSLLGKSENINVQFKEKEIIGDKKQLNIYLGLFCLCLFTVLHLIDYKVTLFVVFMVVLLIDKNLFKNVDYGLLETFICFFIFVGNMGKIGSVSMLIASFIEKRELVFAVLLSQIFSNVPTAVLLSNFTLDYKSLILGTNIGGLGTLIASLASLISFKLYVNTENAKPLKYLGIFTAINLLMIIILLLFSSINSI